MAYTWYQLEDGADSTLTAAINSSVTSMTLTDASEFPATGSFLVTIWDPIGHDEPADDANMEIVTCTSRSGNVLTVTRGFGDTSAAAHNEDDRAGLYDNKAIVEQITAFIDAGAYDELSVDVTVTDLTASVNAVQGIITKNTGDGDLGYNINGVYGKSTYGQTGGVLGNVAGGTFYSSHSDGGCVNQRGIYVDASASGGTISNDLIGIYDNVSNGGAAISGDLIGVNIEIDHNSGTVTGDVIGLRIADDTAVDYAIYQDGTAKSSLAALDVGDGTNYTEIKADGEIVLHGTARTTRRLMYPCPDGSVPPDEVISDYFIGWSFDIGDDAIVQAALPCDWDQTTDIDIYVEWYIDEAYATDSGEVQWRASAGDVFPGESVTTPPRTATNDSGDINIPATANLKVSTNVLTIPAASLVCGSVLGVKFERIAIDDGSDPTADPVCLGITINYIVSNLGVAT